jgi:segregation and condensation protein B
MSLRGKIEAVIYAAEEPVTLAQLAGLFGAEALVERGERLGRERAVAGVEAGAEPALFESSVAFDPGQSAEDAAGEHAEGAASDAAIEQAVEHPEQVAASQADGFAPEQAEGQGDAAPAVLVENERWVARKREREAREEIRRALEELIAAYDQGDRGVEIREIAGGYRVATKPEYHDAVRGFVKSLKPVMKLSLQALETLAVIAYKQPVTAPEVSEIRGVDSGGVMGSLISRKLVTTAGRKQVIGRPILYKTTKEFLLRFGLKDLGELPSMEEFERMAGELVEAEPGGQLELAAGEGERAMEKTEGEAAAAVAFVGEPSAAADVQAAPELAEEREEEELRANARANVQVDDESQPLHDLPGVTRDTAGRVDIDRRSYAPSVYDEDEY